MLRRSVVREPTTLPTPQPTHRSAIPTGLHALVALLTLQAAALKTDGMARVTDAVLNVVLAAAMPWEGETRSCASAPSLAVPRPF